MIVVTIIVTEVPCCVCGHNGFGDIARHQDAWRVRLCMKKHGPARLTINHTYIGLPTLGAQWVHFVKISASGHGRQRSGRGSSEYLLYYTNCLSHGSSGVI